MRSTVDAKLSDEEKRRRQQLEKLEATRKNKLTTDSKPQTEIAFDYTPSENLYEIRDIARVEKTENQQEWDRMDGLIFKSRNLASDIERRSNFQSKRSG